MGPDVLVRGAQEGDDGDAAAAAERSVLWRAGQGMSCIMKTHSRHVRETSAVKRITHLGYIAFPLELIAAHVTDERARE